VSTAVLDEEHEKRIGAETVEDLKTGVLYARYGTGLIDLRTGIVLRPVEGPPMDYPEALCMAGSWYLPHRRHLRPASLVAELAAAGFKVAFLDETHAGSMACTLEAKES
jgi:hypothetical protein